MRLIDTDATLQGSYSPITRYFMNRNPASLAKPVVNHCMNGYIMPQEYKLIARWGEDGFSLMGTAKERWGFGDYEYH